MDRTNGDHSYKHMVVRTDLGFSIICITEGLQPAVYNDSGPAELYAAQLREKYPENRYHVASFQVL